jgi:hypothetical protein
MGADFLKQQSAEQLDQGWDLQPTYAVEERPSCVARLAKTIGYLLLIGFLLFVAYICVTVVLAGSI